MPTPANLVWETTTSSASPYTLTAVAQSFNGAFGTGGTDKFDVFMRNRSAAGEWMRATGHLSAASTLVIDTVKEGSNGTSEVAWSAGTIDVTNAFPAEDLLSINSQTIPAADQARARLNISAPLKGHIYGLTLSNNASDATNDIDIAAGEAASTETNPVLMVLGSSITKQLDAAWAVGTNAGGRDTGSIGDGAWQVWLIRRSDTGVVDALFSRSATSPTMPTNYDQKRRIGAIVRVSAAIKAFTQDGDYFRFTTGINDATPATVGTSRSLIQLSVPAGMRAHFRAYGFNATTGNVGFLIQNPAETDRAPGAYSSLFAESTNLGAAAHFDVATDSSSQIAVRASAASSSLHIETFGWLDVRGK